MWFFCISCMIRGTWWCLSRLIFSIRILYDKSWNDEFFLFSWNKSRRSTIFYGKNAFDNVRFCWHFVILRSSNYLDTPAKVKLWKSIQILVCKKFHLSFFIILIIRWIQQNQIYNKFRDLTKNWTQIACLAVSHSNHYTRMFFWACMRL